MEAQPLSWCDLQPRNQICGCWHVSKWQEQHVRVHSWGSIALLHLSLAWSRAGGQVLGLNRLIALSIGPWLVSMGQCIKPPPFLEASLQPISLIPLNLYHSIIMSQISKNSLLVSEYSLFVVLFSCQCMNSISLISPKILMIDFLYLLWIWSFMLEAVFRCLVILGCWLILKEEALKS